MNTWQVKKKIFILIFVLRLSVNHIFSQFTEHPNVVFMLTDDQGYGDIGKHGNPVLKTPNMDQLFEESMRFTDFLVSPTCAPTRAAIMSGMHEFKVGVTHTLPGRSNLDPEVETLPEVFKSAGYVTGMFGKWHLGLDSLYRPENRGFDIALTSAGWEKEHADIYFDPVLFRNGIKEKHEGYRTNILFDEAIQFIEENRDTAFFCYIPTYSPHEPLKVPEKYSNMYDGNNFFGMIACIDENLGILLNKLEQLNLTENTLVIFMNDNGATFGSDIWNARMRGVKTTAWYGGTRANSFWRWPGTIIPTDCDALTAHVDILPTIAELVDVDIPYRTKNDLDGRSLVPLLKSPNHGWPDRMLVTHVGRWNKGAMKDHKYCQVSIRFNHYSLVRIEACNDPLCRAECTVFNRVKSGGKGYYSKINSKFNYATTPEGEWALYDIKNDLSQAIDNSDQYSSMVNRLMKKYDEWWEDIAKYLDN